MKKLISAIKRRRFKKLCKKYPFLMYNDIMLAIKEILHTLYDTDPEKIFMILDILKIKHFYNCNQLIVHLWINTKYYVYNIVLEQPKCWDKGEEKEDEMHL